MQTQTLIVGAGLSGLSIAAQLAEQGHNFLLIEARDRPGGRILTETHGGGYFDLGPAWFWRDQPRIAALINRLGLSWFEQHSKGALSFEDEHGRVQRGERFPSMLGSNRVNGGFGALSDALAAKLPENHLLLSSPVTMLAKSETGITATTQNGHRISAKRVVLALPPRIAGQITFSPSLPQDTLFAMTNIPTWMAGQAKAVATYDQPFWRMAGLSGDVMSRRGPMVEIHDASPLDGESFALFGFIGVAPQSRRDQRLLRDAIQEQLIRLFGTEAAKPTALFIKDWATDPFTSTEYDQQPLYAHPQYGLPYELTGIWNNQLIFSGTEVADQFGGYVEGALEAAESALALIEPERV